jgi:hypothetical protein
MPGLGLVGQLDTLENLSTPDVATTIIGAGAPDGAVAIVGAEVDHVASCGWPYASACPRCFPPSLSAVEL